jgi:hypothetical protein
VSKLVSMKMSSAEQRKRTEPSSIASDAPMYPWGLSLNLDNETLEKLKVDELPEVGDERLVIAKVKVTSVSSNESESGSNKSVSLQITEMCLEDAGEKAAAESKLYGEA